jgi:hypothetical protein
MSCSQLPPQIRSACSVSVTPQVELVLDAPVLLDKANIVGIKLETKCVIQELL